MATEKLTQRQQQVWDAIVAYKHGVGRSRFWECTLPSFGDEPVIAPCYGQNISHPTLVVLERAGLIVILRDDTNWFRLTDAGREALKNGVK